MTRGGAVFGALIRTGSVFVMAKVRLGKDQSKLDAGNARPAGYSLSSNALRWSCSVHFLFRVFDYSPAAPGKCPTALQLRELAAGFRIHVECVSSPCTLGVIMSTLHGLHCTGWFDRSATTTDWEIDEPVADHDCARQWRRLTLGNHRIETGV
jgi:hypothetical protein